MSFKPRPKTPSTKPSTKATGSILLPLDWTPDKADTHSAAKLGLSEREIARLALGFRFFHIRGAGSYQRHDQQGWRDAWLSWVEQRVGKPQKSRRK